MTKPKMSALVASAIRNLREIRGSTSKEIMSYIKSQYTGSDSNIQKQVINSSLIHSFAQKARCYIYTYFYDISINTLIFYFHHRSN